MAAKVRHLCKLLGQGSLRDHEFDSQLYESIREDPEQWDELCDALKRGEADDLFEGVARMLRMFPSPEAVEPLCRALSNERPAVREAAALALGASKDQRAVDALCGALTNDENSSVRCWSAKALGQIADPRAFDSLCRALEDKESSVHLWAAEALGTLKDERAYEPLCQILIDDELSTARKAAAAALAEIGDFRAVEPLAQALGDEDASVQATAAEALGKFGVAAVAPLCKVLNDASSNLSLRYQAVEALARIRDSRAINALCRAIVDSPTSEPYRAADAEVQWAAVDSLANFGARAIKPLCQLLDNSHAAVCRRAGWALVGIGRRAALSLCRIVADRSRDPLARQEAAASLGQLQDRRTVRILCHTLADENPAVRAAVVRALQGIGDPRAEKYLTRAMSDPDLQSLVSSDDRQQLAGVAWTATPWTYASLRYFTLEPDGTGKLIYGYGQTIYADIRCKWFLPRPGRLRLTYLESPGEQFVPAFRPTNENASKTIGYRLIEEPISGEKMSGRYEYHWTLELSDHPWPTNLNLPYGTPRVFYGGTE